MLFLGADAYKAVDDLTHLADIVKRHLEQAAYTNNPTYYRYLGECEILLFLYTLKRASTIATVNIEPDCHTFTFSILQMSLPLVINL
jgi:hypothetical protein